MPDARRPDPPAPSPSTPDGARPGPPHARRRWLALALWALAVALFWGLAQRRPGGASGLLGELLTVLADSRYALPALLGVYLLRPLLLLPITLLTVFAGFLLGLAGGLAFALAATLASASVAYALARRLAPPPGDPPGEAPDASPGGAPGALRRLRRRLRRNAFEAVLTARLALLPGDLVNYAAGALRVPFAPFAVATLLGGLPGLTVGVMAGRALQPLGAFEARGVRLEPGYLLASALLLGASLLAARRLRRSAG